ncbi:MAG: ATP-binding protein, partial [Microcystis sp.]
MTLPIQVLPQDVIDLIAAGEVIDSLGAMVRELVENAIDAGADRITIDISPQNWRIQVSDNGRGMSRE